ncbi:MAG: hypothetical protein AAGA96_19185, partial [Verrucomicrobiota bacterium]
SEVRPFLNAGFLKKWRTKFESAIYNLDKLWGEVPGEWLSNEGDSAEPTLTRQEIEAQLIKPELPVDGILPG